MFKWRRKSEGFEWRDYVRTTILVRRKERRERVKHIQAAAVENIKHAGKIGLESSAQGASWAGRSTASAIVTTMSWLWDRSAKAVAATGPALRSAAGAMATGVGRALDALRPFREPVLGFLRRPNTRVALNIVALILAGAVVLQVWTVGLDLNTTLVALAAAVIAGLAIAAKHADRGSLWAGDVLDRLGRPLVLLPGFDRLHPSQAGLVAILGVIALMGTGVWLKTGHSTSSSATPAKYAVAARPDPAADVALAGRATAIAGDRLKVRDTVVRLEGIEAPDPDQTCDRPSGKWKCGSAAREALSRAVRGRRVTCELTGKDETGIPIARCLIGETDVAGSLVQSGHVFAEQGLFARYGSDERTAKLAKIGLWSGGADRPADFRAKRWDEAKSQAPEGCPIKGRVASGARVYVLPWSSTYDSVRVSATRGERWFCSEEEAQAAGWKPQTASRS